MYFDGSDVELSGEDVNAAALDANGDIHLSTTNAFAVTGVSGDDEDVFTFMPSQLGANTAGTYASSLLFDGSLFGLAANDIRGMDLPGNGAGVKISESGGSTDVTEGGATDTYDVVLLSQPLTGTTVTITIATTDGQTTTTPTSLIFDENDWDTPQTVIVTAVDDTLGEGSPHMGTITHTATSADTNYDGIGINDVVANITDNDDGGRDDQRKWRHNGCDRRGRGGQLYRRARLGTDGQRGRDGYAGQPDRLGRRRRDSHRADLYTCQRD